MFRGPVTTRRLPTPAAQLCLALALALGAGGCVGAISGSDSAMSSAPAAPPSGGTGGPAPAGAPTACESAGDLTPARIWRLSDEDYGRAIADLLPGITVPVINTPGRSDAEFVNDAELYPVEGALVSDLRSAAKTVAAAAVTNLDARLGCAPGQEPRACAQTFIEAFATRAYRRPLEPADKDALTALYDSAASESMGAGVQLVIEAVLQSPSFLYRTELGAPGGGPRVELTAYERASALSFFLLGSIPDPPLLAAAADGSLATPAGYRRQIDRLLGDARVREHLGRVLTKWIGLGGGVTTELAADQFPDYDDALKASMLGESGRVLDDLLSQQGTFVDLLTSRRSFVDKRLAALYGVTYAGSGDFVETMLPADQRTGLLTQAAFIVNQSRGEPIVHRGKWVREELLCGEMPDPPAGINTTPPTDPNISARQFSEMRMNDPTCGACHQLMDGIGLTFGNYDPLSRYVIKDDAGRPIDPSGVVAGSDVAGPVENVRALAQRLAGSAQVRACIETRMLSYALGRDLDPQSFACEQKQIDDQIAGGGHRLLDMMGAVALAPAFHVRGNR